MASSMPTHFQPFFERRAEQILSGDIAGLLCDHTFPNSVHFLDACIELTETQDLMRMLNMHSDLLDSYGVDHLIPVLCEVEEGAKHRYRVALEWQFRVGADLHRNSVTYFLFDLPDGVKINMVDINAPMPDGFHGQVPASVESQLGQST